MFPVCCLSLSSIYFWRSSGKGTKSKNKQMGLHQTKELLHIKGNHQQNEKKNILNGRRCLQKMCPRRDEYPDYIKNSHSVQKHKQFN